jgi:two-component system response regulator HydG
MAAILIIDDNDTIRDGLAHAVRKLGHETATAASGPAGLAAFRARPGGFDFVITDLKMDGLTGVDVLRQLAILDPDCPVMIVTGFGTVETAVEAMKLGAFDFLTKPFPPEVVRLKVERALELAAARRARRKLEAENAYLRDEQRARFDEIIGGSPKIAAVLRAIEKVAPAATTVYIAGESGTGKELVARAIHRLSGRADGPFVKVNCGALTETLLESELFGHEKGAFTGAIKQKLGRFELADKGTLFLDEVGDVPPAMQVKLLRALQEQEFERVGGETPIKVDVRVLSATNKDLEREVAEGRFRQDLFYRCTSCRCACRRCAIAARTSRSWPSTSSTSSGPRPTRGSRRWATRRSAGSWPTTGRATCASSRTRSSRRWSSPTAPRSRSRPCRRSCRGRRPATTSASTCRASSACPTSSTISSASSS